MSHDRLFEAVPTDTRKHADWTKSIRLSAFLCLSLALPLCAKAGDLHDAAQAGDVETVKTSWAGWILHYHHC